MQTIKIESDTKHIFITCPHCGDCEQHPIDEQRHHLQTFDILHWNPNRQKHEHEQSAMMCHHCEGEFVSEWDYQNTIEDDY